MDSQQKTPSRELEAEPESEAGVPGLWRVWGEVQRGAGSLPRVGALPASRTGRFAHGVGLPWQVLRTLLAEPRLRRRYLTVGLAQAGTTLALGLLFTSWGKDLAGPR